MKINSCSAMCKKYHKKYQILGLLFVLGEQFYVFVNAFTLFLPFFRTAWLHCSGHSLPYNKNRRREAAAERGHPIYTNRMLSASRNCAGK